MGKQTITIPEIPRSPNGAGGLLRMNWRQREQYFKTWVYWVRSGITWNPDEPVKIKVQVHIHQVRIRKLDKDNLYASCKPVLDALEKLNLIFKDSEEWIELLVTQDTGRQAKTIITIEAL